MTREEAIKDLTKLIQYGGLVGIQCYEALNMAIEVLEHPERNVIAIVPCDDAKTKKIDEWEIKGKKAELWIIKGNLQVRYLGTIHNIPLPSVTPQEPKTGHWIVHPKGIYAHLVCDKCLSNAPYDCCTNYCPNCGAKMESEVV